MSDPWSPEVSEAVSRHMNDDHGADCLRLVQALGGRPDARSVRMAGCDPDGLVFVVDGGDECLVPWGIVPTSRVEIRHEVVRLHEVALAALAQTSGATSRA